MFTTAISKIILLLALISVLCGSASAATKIEAAANALSPGQWVKMTTMSNINVTADFPAWEPATTGSIGPGFDSWQPGWDSHNKKLYIITAEHNGGLSCPEAFPKYPHVCWKPMWTYDDATDTWDVGATGTWTGDHSTSTVTVTGVYPHEGTSTPVNTFHAWNLPAWDNTNEILYIGGSYNFPSQGYRYCVNNTPSWCSGKQGVWTKLPAGPTERSGNSPQAAVFHEALNAGTGGTLLYYDGDGWGTGCGGLYAFRESTGTWSVLSETNCGLPGISHNTLAFYSHAKGIAVFGGGTNFYKIDAVGTISALDAPPCTMNTTNPGFAMPSEDPVSGDFYIIACKQPSKLIKLNPTASTGSQWSVVDSNLASVGKICNILRDTSSECALDVYATPISSYGVIGFWKFIRNSPIPHTAEYWLYKASASSDLVAPTVSITAPAASATVSGTLVSITASASDNVGVSGVQFKLDGSNLGTEDTVSPYAIIWDSTGATNGSHTISAVARDAAGNTATSIGVSVTVSNASGGSDFATRCALSGVIVCEGFDSSSVVSNTSDGPQGINNSGLTLPTIDTTVKASGAGSLKLTVPAQTGLLPPANVANTSGNYWRNFSDDFLTQFNGNTTFYVQFRWRASSCFLRQGSAEPCTGGLRTFLNGGGWKVAHIGTGDKPGCGPSNSAPCYTSCSDLETVPQNTFHRGFAQMYHSCPSNGVPLSNDDSVQVGSDFLLQSSRASPFCLYSQAGAGTQFPPTGNCFGFFSDEWMTFQIGHQLGTRISDGSGHDFFQNSTVTMWIAREGQPSELVTTWGPVNLYAGPTGDGQQFGKVFLNNYNTGKDQSEAHPAMAVWYDELIVRSGTQIPDPGVGGSVPPVAPSGFKLK